MGFYDLTKEERAALVRKIDEDVQGAIFNGKWNKIITYFSDEDTYIRKAGYQAIGKLYRLDTKWITSILDCLEKLLESDNPKVRQTTINAAGEVGMLNFGIVRDYFDVALLDHHHSVRNAVIGSVKKMGQKNPKPVLKWAATYLDHPSQEIRREICHGIELRGRTHPQDILPLLRTLQFDETTRVGNTLIHVLGQISYKKGCLETVIKLLNTWDNKVLVEKALAEIVNVHERYKDFAVLTQRQAMLYIEKNYTGKLINRSP